MSHIRAQQKVMYDEGKQRISSPLGNSLKEDLGHNQLGPWTLVSNKWSQATFTPRTKEEVYKRINNLPSLINDKELSSAFPDIITGELWSKMW